MSSPARVKNQSGDGIAIKAEKRWPIGRVSRLPGSNAASPTKSTSGPTKSKIPTNIGHTARPAMQENSRLPGTIASEDTTADKTRRPTSKSATRAPSNPQTPSSQPPPSQPTSSNVKSKLLNTTLGGNSAMMKRQFENQFAIKKKRYTMLKKELMEKQKNASDLYEEMSQLRDKLIVNNGKDPGKIETINLTAIPPMRLAEGFHGFRGSTNQEPDPLMSLDSALSDEVVSSLEAKLRLVPDRCFEYCQELLRKQPIDSLSKRLIELRDKNEEEKIENNDIDQELEIYHKDMSDFQLQLEESKKTDEKLINDTIEMINELRKQVQVSRDRIRESDIRSEEIIREMSVNVEAALMEKKTETERYEKSRQRNQALDNELQKLGAKIRSMDIQASENETKITQLQSTIKSLESQLKQKEFGAEQRFKEIQKSLKNSESILAKTEKQRDNFQSRLNELKKSSGLKQTEADNKIKELSLKLDAEINKHHEKDEIGQGESQLTERDNRIARLEREKEDLIRLMDNGLLGGSSTFRLDGEKISHETIVSTLTKKIQDIRTNLKITQEKKEILERQLSELRSRIESRTKESEIGKSVSSSHQVAELEQRLCDYRCTINELTRRNEELEIQLNQKQLEIDEQDRAMREQSTVLKVRDEVIGLLKGRPDARTSYEGGGHVSIPKKKSARDRDQVDKEIAQKTENLHQLYSTLETKQMQITHLERIVKEMEVQQDRAQEQRTRLEKKIASLQLQMHYRTKNHQHRYVKTANGVLSSSKISSAPATNLHENSVTSENLRNNIDKQCKPRSYSRSPPPSLPRYPQMQRSKTLNSIKTVNIKSKNWSTSKVYTAQVMDEIARTLRREREYDYEKNRESRDIVERRCSNEDRGSKIIDPTSSVSKEAIHESFYNWLVEPWMLEESGETLNPSSPIEHNQWPKGYTVSSEISLNATRENVPPRRHRTANDRSRESRCASPESRRKTTNYTTTPALPRTTQLLNNSPRSRKPRS